MHHRTHPLVGVRFPLLALLLAGLSAAAELRKPAADLTGPWQLFIDDSIVAEKSGVVRRYHAFKKHADNPVLKPELPWEGKAAYLYGTVLPGEKGSGYRMWYQSWAGGEYRTLYATSEDGLRWGKPALGLVDFDGSRQNNLLLSSTQPWHQPQVISIPTEKDPARKYALISYDYGNRKPDRVVSGFRLAYSPDGLRWTESTPGPVLADPGDVGIFTWDQHAEKFIGYTKVFAPVNGYRRRAIGYTSSADLRQWTPSELILVPDEFDDRWVTQDRQHTDFYGLSAFPYESGYVGFLWIFRITDGVKDGPIFVELVSSRDGVNWIRQEGDRPPILPVGAAGTWDAGMIFTPNHPLVEGDTLKLYYGGFATTHGAKEAIGATGLATLRKDGFASLEAGEEAGVITTKLLRHARGELRVNALASKGSIKAELRDRDGCVIPGYGFAECLGISGDGIDQRITWRRQERLPEKSDDLTISFSLQNSALFSFRAGEPLGIAPERPLAAEALTFEDSAWSSRVRLHGAAKIEVDPGKGSKALALSAVGDAAELLGTAHLGTEFTLVARVKTGRPRLSRVFSTHRGTGDFVSGELVLDINPRTGVLRFIVNGQRVQSAPRLSNDKEYHHYAAVYANGQVSLYQDGVLVGAGAIRQGTAHLFNSESVIEHFGPVGMHSRAGVHLASDLRLGADHGGRFLTNQEVAKVAPTAPLIGHIDDIVVVRRALPAEEIQALAR